MPYRHEASRRVTRILVRDQRPPLKVTAAYACLRLPYGCDLTKGPSLLVPYAFTLRTTHVYMRSWRCQPPPLKVYGTLRLFTATLRLRPHEMPVFIGSYAFTLRTTHGYMR